MCRGLKAALSVHQFTVRRFASGAEDVAEDMRRKAEEALAALIAQQEAAQQVRATLQTPAY